MNPVSKPRAPTLAVPARPRPLRLLGLGAVTAMAFVITACATKLPAPTQDLALSRAAIESAVRAGAVELAPSELDVARQKQVMAEAALAQEQNERALLLSREVQVDARLAEARARSSRATRASNELREDGRVLRQEINRSAPQ